MSGTMSEQLAEKIAKFLPRAGTLTCRQCGERRLLRRGQVARYLAQGWPECCGVTMVWASR